MSTSRPQFMQAAVELTGAQIRKLHTNPVELAPAPGPGKALIPFYFGFQFTPGPVHFQPAALEIVYAGEAAPGLNLTRDLSSPSPFAQTVAYGRVIEPDFAADKALVVRAGTAAGLGNGKGRMTCWYVLADVLA